MEISLDSFSPEVQQFIQSELARGKYHTVEEVVEAVLLPLAKKQQAKPEEKPRRKAGNGEGKVWMSPDFDEPLEEFKDYM